MEEVRERLIIGAQNSCRSGSGELAVVHACKSPCHQNAVGYQGSLANEHPNYLRLEGQYDLYLNLVDPPIPLFKLESFDYFMQFASKHWSAGRDLLIHCNQGLSRSPSLAMVFMAKQLGELPDESYLAARREFEQLYPSYQPGKGIQTFLADNWGSIEAAS